MDLRTTAKETDRGWVINGSKRWISNGGEADQYLVYCRLNDAPGTKAIGAIVVDKGTPGFSFGASERLMGFRGIPRPTSTSTTSRCPWRTWSSRPATSGSCSASSPSSASATPR